jgi:hypothetical protein
MTAEPASAMQPDDPMQRSGAVWCEVHTRWECSRDSKRSKARCHGPAMTGLDRCRMHVGTKSSVARARGEANLVAWSLEAAGGLPAVDPGDRMMALIHLTTARHAVYAHELQEQYEAERAGGLVGATWAVGRGGESVQSGEQLRGLAKLEADERDRLARYLKNAHDMGIAERVIELHQGQAQLVVSAFMAGLGALPGLLPADRDAALRAFLTGLGRGPEVLELGPGTVTE